MESGSVAEGRATEDLMERTLCDFSLEKLSLSSCTTHLRTYLKKVTPSLKPFLFATCETKLRSVSVTLMHHCT